MIRVNQEEHVQYVAAKATGTPYDASGFEFHGSSVPFISESCLTNIDDWADRAVTLFLFERCSGTIGAGIAMRAKWLRLIDNSVPIGEDEYRWSHHFHEEGANGLFHRGSKAECGSFLE